MTFKSLQNYFSDKHETTNSYLLLQNVFPMPFLAVRTPPVGAVECHLVGNTLSIMAILRFNLP